MKEKRNLSGIYFRYKSPEGMENICFEDLPEEEQDKILSNENVDDEYLKRLVKQLADTLNRIGDYADIIVQ